jgi:putative ABC transport system permease protein
LSDLRFIEPDYFHTMGIALLRGRLFSAADDGSRDAYVVINDHFAHRYWPDSDPIGQQLQLAGNPRVFTIIGVVANSRDRGLGRDTRNTIYFSDLQTSTLAARGFQLLVRARNESPELLNNIRQALLTTNNELYLGEVRMLDDVLSQSLSPQRFSATLMTAFATIAFCLALVGVYGVTSYSVAQRRHEIGVRMALGARPGDVMLMVVRQGARLALVGVSFGIIGALATTRLAGKLLFGVSARDPLTILMVCILLGGVAVLACCIPARRAMRVQPVIALRGE